MSEQNLDDTNAMVDGQAERETGSEAIDPDSAAGRALDPDNAVDGTVARREGAFGDDGADDNAIVP